MLTGEATIRLYHDNRDRTFKDVTAKSGLGRSVWAAGITVGDNDNDGFDDIFITCWGRIFCSTTRTTARSGTLE